MTIEDILVAALSEAGSLGLFVAVALLVGNRVERRIDQLFQLIETLIQVIITDKPLGP